MCNCDKKLLNGNPNENSIRFQRLIERIFVQIGVYGINLTSMIVNKIYLTAMLALTYLDKLLIRWSPTIF